MGGSPISRRSLLRAGAGAVVGAALRGPASLAARATRDSGSIELPRLGSAPRTLTLPARVGVVGLELPGRPRDARAWLRVRLPSGAWGPWTAALGAHHGPEGRPSGAEPLWIGGAREVELRSAAPLAGAALRWVRADPSASGGARAEAAALPLAQPVLAAGRGQPPILARAAWARGTQLPRVAPAYGKVEVAFVHHTENPNGYAAAQVPAMLRAIYAFHRDVNGWNDIGYNFVVDLFGRAWEARAGGIDEPVVGAHAGGYNLASTGVAVLGSFTGTPISAAARRTLQELLAWKLALHGTPARGRTVVRVNPAGALYSKYPAGAKVSLPRIAGHRDADATDCPGGTLYGELPGVRRAVAARSGNPVLATLALAPAAAEVPASAPPAGAGEAAPAASPVPVLVAALATPAGAPLTGLRVLLQARSVARRGELVTHTTVGEGLTDGEGRCPIAAVFAQGAAKPMWVRAMFAGAGGLGAAVSPAVLLEPPAPVSPPPATVPSG